MKYDTVKYKTRTWKNSLMLHWILNPALAINELILGQRIPKVILIEKDNKRSLPERSFIPCPHCGTLHPALKWSSQNKTAIKNWFGLYCDSCGGIIPCLTNLTSYLLLGLTYPIWIWFKKSWKEKWLTAQREKFSKPLLLTPPEFNWRNYGLRWSLFMFVFMEILFPLIDGQKYNIYKLAIGIIVWALAGLGYGYLMKKILARQARIQEKKKINQED